MIEGGAIISLDLPGAEGGILGRDYDHEKVQTRGREGVNDPFKGHPSRVHRERDWLPPDQQGKLVIRSDSGGESRDTKAKG